MSFEHFVDRCIYILKKSGEEIVAEFCNDDGMYIALFSNGVKIVGNSICPSVRVMWGSGHQSIARI